MRAFLSIAFASTAVAFADSSPEEDAFLQDLIQVQGILADPPAPKVDPWCVARYCGGAGKKCFFDSQCRAAIKCTAGCGSGVNQTCIFQCTSDFENDVYDDMLYCMFNEHDCFNTKKGYDKYQSCRPLDKVKPMTEYRGKPLTQDVAKELLLRSANRGDWMVAKGKSAAYDCFDCQYLYFVPQANGMLSYVANYKIHKSNGGVRWNIADYNATEWSSTSAGRYTMNSSNYGGLAHYEDWRLLAADESENPEWIAFYYCGSAPGVGEAYEGAFILTPDGNLPKEEVNEKLTNMFADAGIELQCKTNNSDCSGHPAPPTALRDVATFVV